MPDPADKIREALVAYAARDHCTCPEGADAATCSICGKPDSVNVPALADLTELEQQLAEANRRSYDNWKLAQAAETGREART